MTAPGFETLKETASFGGVQGVYRHESTACGGPMELSVFVPGGPGPFPTLYYLSGLTCTAMNVTEKSGFQRLAAELGVVVVCPDTSPRGAGYPGEDDDWDFGSGAGFYVDATQAPWSARYRMWSYVSDELPRLVDLAFPTRGPDARGVTGHSMGGHGALTLALRQPNAWRSVSAFAPIVAPTRVPWGQKALTGYLGADRSAWSAHDATALVSSGARHPSRILVDQGAADPFLERELRPEVFEAACRDADQPLTLRRHAGYDHSYYFVATFMEDHLRHHAALLT